MNNHLSSASQLANSLVENIAKSIFGQKDLIVEATACFLASGHILITGAPGLAKTTLVRALAQCLGLKFHRIQFTPDLLPSDILGSEILNLDPESGNRSFRFVKGPIFTNLLLADEINRASPRTQSAMLEAMQEKQVTIAGEGHDLPLPFMVFATQNPFESEGTFPLPEAQLDRFLLHSLVDYPDHDAEKRMLLEHSANRLGQLDQEVKIFDTNEVQKMQKASLAVGIEESVVHLINELVRSTRPNDALCPSEFKANIAYGAGPRAGISLISACRGLALLEGDDHVRWKHICRLAKPVLRHRVRLNLRQRRDELSADALIDQALVALELRHKNLATGQT